MKILKLFKTFYAEDVYKRQGKMFRSNEIGVQNSIDPSLLQLSLIHISSHTGAIASSDSAVEALFRKAGIVRCFSREELTTVGCVFTLPELKGKNFAIITHAGGPGVMLTDALSKGGLNVPKLEGEVAEELKAQLFPGAAVGNPIDILATGTPEHLRLCIDYCEEKLDYIDAMMAIFGTPGLVTMFEMYDVLHEKMQTCKKPIFPILPSINTALSLIHI